ncbi:hypothetical protein [Acinetobacter sp. NCu2D-2]|uniref:hypothetical protein n=1 Tax=Acinetobacter sp. NCu2D-2 TaxID=1608473 RepID=UPI001D0D7AC2|nr:hypothetical protein [Acinetobacter sp. NCu2D-2]
MAALSGCSYFVSIDEVARHVEAQMQREFNANIEYKNYHLVVDDVQITERKGNEFKAISKLKYQGQPFVIDVVIYKENGGFGWKIDHDAFSFIDEIEIAKYQQQLDDELRLIAQSIEKEPQVVVITYQANQTSNTDSSYTVKSYDEQPYPVGNVTAYSK